MLYGTMESLGEGSAFEELGVNIANITREYDEGILTTAQYFEQLETQLNNLDMESMFGKNREAAQTFFTGLTYQATESLAKISNEFDKGEITITKYMDTLSQISDVFSMIGNMAIPFLDSLDLPGQQIEEMKNTVLSSISEIESASQELRDMQELNVMVQDAYVKAHQGTLQFQTEAFNEYMQQIAIAAAQSGQVYKDLEGNALTSADQIYKFLTAETGNFQIFADQTANKSGNAIKKIIHSVAEMLRTLGDGISNFKGEIKITPHQTGMMNFEGSFFGDVLNMIGIPEISLSFGAEGFNFPNIGNMLSDFANNLDTQAEEIGLDANVYLNPASLTGAAGEADNLADTLGSVSNAFKNLGKASKDATKETKDDLKDMGKLLDMVVDKIKQEQKALKDRLKQQLSDYKKIISRRKELLRSMEKEKQYQDDLEDKQSNLSRIQNEIIEARLDDSEEGQARLLQLQQEAADAQKEIDNAQYEHGIDLQEQALDEEAKNYEDYINSQIQAIDQYLSKPGQIVADAMNIVEAKGQSLYSDLLKWNQQYGSGINADVVSAWNDAYSVLNKYKNSLGELDYQNAALKLAGLNSPNIPDTTGVDLRENPYMRTIGTGITPSSFASMSGIPAYDTTGMNINIESVMPIVVQGNMDEGVVSDMEALSKMVVDQINSLLLQRGINRTADSFSI